MKINGYTIDKIRKAKYQNHCITFTANGDNCLIESKEFYLEDYCKKGVIDYITESERPYVSFGERDFAVETHEPIAPDWDELNNDDIAAILEYYLNEEYYEECLEDTLMYSAMKYKNKDVNPIVPKKVVLDIINTINKIGGIKP